MKTWIVLWVSVFLAPVLASAEFAFSAETKVRQELTLVALGKRPADLIIRGANVLDVFTLTWRGEQDIVIEGERIAWVGEVGGWPGEAEMIVEAHGEWAVPGFGESHKHIESSHVTPDYEAQLVIPRGNTWTVEGSHEFSNVAGDHNIDFWLEAARHKSPLKIYVAIGSATPPTAFETGAGYYGYDEVAKFLEQDLRVAGLGEVMDWTSVWNPESPGYGRMWEVIQATIDARGVVEGHGYGLTSPDEVNAFAAAGLSSDHSIISAVEGWRKIQSGVFAQLKPDACRILIPLLLEKGIKDWSNISVSTDDRDVLASLELGTMDYNIRTAIESGAPVEVAYAMGSYYPARHWHLEHLVGSIAPGRYADVVLLDDLASVVISRVFANGRLASEGERYLLEVPKIEYPEWARNTIRIGRRIEAADFQIRAPAGRDEVEAAILEQFYFGDELPSETLKVENGLVQRAPERGISKVAMVDRYDGRGRVSKMFWRGVGLISPNSAVACSVAHDLHNIWTTGSSDRAMAMAVDELAEMGGGWCLVREGETVARVRYEIGGLMSQRPVEEVAAELDYLYTEADKMEWIGQPGLPRRMIFAFLTCTPWKWVLVAPSESNPSGLINVTDGQTHPIVW